MWPERGATGRQAMHGRDSRFLDAESHLRLRYGKKQSRVDRDFVCGPFCLSQFGPTFNGRAPAGVQNKGVEQEAGRGWTRFEGEVQLRGMP